MRLLAAAVLCAGAAAGADFQAGLGRADITPPIPIPMSGYAARSKPAESVAQKLWAKALALEDPDGRRAAIVTLDLITVPRPLAEEVAARVQQEHRIERARLLINCSHTHAGPQVLEEPDDFSDLPPRPAIVEYTRLLTEQIVAAIGSAVGDLRPVRLEIGHGQAAFAGNRREFTATGVKIGVNPRGPTDHDVPVLRIAGKDGRLRGILFGYACHNTTMTAQNLQIAGDYAGFAQAEIERAHPGATAMFLQLCGADQNPQPRGTLELAQQHGKELAGAVEAVLRNNKVKRVRPPVRTAFERIELAFPPYERADFERKLQDKNKTVAHNARYILKRLDQGRPVRSISYPVQAIRFGKDLSVVALGGEVVIDYGLRAKREFGRDLVVAGYSNDVLCYIPSLRVLKEGGYEAVDSQYYSGLPGAFAEDVEERIFAAMRRVLAAAGLKAAR